MHLSEDGQGNKSGRDSPEASSAVPIDNARSPEKVEVAEERKDADCDPLLGPDPSFTSSSSRSISLKPGPLAALPDADSFNVEMGVDQEAVMTKINLHILPIFFSLAMLCTIDRANLSFAASQLNHDLNFSKTVYGYGSGVFFIGYSVLALPTPFICDKIGAPLFLGSILIIWGFTATLFAFMSNSWQFLVLRFLLGITESGAYPGMWYHLALFYTETELGLAYTIVSTASSLSGAAGGPMASLLLNLDGCWGFRGWQWLFLLEGVPPVILGVVMIFFLAREPSSAAFLLPEERRWLVDRKAVSTQEEGGKKVDESAATAWTSLVTMLSEWRMWWLSAIWMVVVLGVDCMVFWIPLMLRSMLYGELDSSLSEAEKDEAVKAQGIRVAALSCIPFATAAVGMLVTASIAKRTGERHWCIILPLLLGGTMLAVLPISEEAVGWLGVIILAVACAGVWGPHGPLLSWPAKILDGTAAAAGFALIKMVGSFASFAGNAAVGKLHDLTGSFVVPTYMMAGIMGVGILLTASFKDHEGNRAMGILQLIESVRKAARTYFRPAEYSLNREASSKSRWTRIGGTQAESNHTPFEMPDFPAFGTEDLTSEAFLHRK